MLCCVGLLAGAAAGQYLGGPWTSIAPIAGFGIGLAADMKPGTCFHKKEHRRDADLGTVKGMDPVCGMAVDEGTVQHRLEHLGTSYYFCTPGCKSSFQADPEKYIGKMRQAA